MDENLPITTDKRDLLTRPKQTAVYWEVRLDDWRQRKMNFAATVDFSRGPV